MTPQDKSVFDAASPQMLRRLLRRRGVFVSDDTPKKDLCRLFGIAFSYQEYKELKERNHRHADNWVEFVSCGNFQDMDGPLARLLLDSHDFEATPFAYSVWELSGNRGDGTPAAILRANQTTLEGALRYMKPDRILVFNHDAYLAPGQLL